MPNWQRRRAFRASCASASPSWSGKSPNLSRPDPERYGDKRRRGQKLETHPRQAEQGTRIKKPKRPKLRSASSKSVMHRGGRSLFKWSAITKTQGLGSRAGREVPSGHVHRQRTVSILSEQINLHQRTLACAG